MTASEFAFLALGLVLGVAAGAALVEVARSRSPGRRDVRVTVAPNSIRIRSRATTLAGETPARDEADPAGRGPGDRSWDHDGKSSDMVEASPAAAQPDRAAAASEGAADPPVEPDAPTPAADESPTRSEMNRTPVPFILRPAGAWAGDSFPAGPVVGGAVPGGSGRPSVGLTIAREADPMMDALRASANADAVGVGVGVGAGVRAATKTRAGHGVAAEEQPLDAGAEGQGGEGSGTAAEDAAAPGAVETGPCADQRRVADERCAVATRARDGARHAAEAIRTAQRDYDNHVGSSEREAAIADPRSVRTAKETAQQAFRKARSAAGSREAVETAARDWLSEINRINHATREASSRAEQHRSAAATLAPSLERLALEADAARISAESAEEACVAAREAVASCEEAAAAASAAAHQAGLPAVESDEVDLGGEIAAASAASEAVPFEDDEDAMGSRAGEDAAIIRLLRGDREILPRIVARLGGDDPDEQRRWRTLLSGLVEALVARSIEAASFDFPAGHPFWGPFTRAQSRDIAAALASLGYRHDGFGGWADDRVPGQRDLSLAVGYAGLDPMRIRQWPTEPEMHDLFSEVTVAADEYVWEAAGSLTLGELVSLLGRRADGLTDLWNDWGAVRPLLLAAG